MINTNEEYINEQSTASQNNRIAVKHYLEYQKRCLYQV